MQDIVIIMFMASMGIFLARFVIKKMGVDLFCGVFSLCTLLLMIKDTTIPTDDLALFSIPEIMILMFTFIHAALGYSKGGY